MTKPVHISDADFDKEVLQSDLPVLVDFWAEWCGPCRLVAPVLDAIAEEYQAKLKIAKVDVEQNKEIASKLGIFSIPTMVLYKNGQMQERIVGYLTKDRLVDKIKSHL
jgi:thioredoxin 1